MTTDFIGPAVLCRTLSVPVGSDKKFPGNRWQYHSRSDRHSRISCWGLAVDLLSASARLRSMADQGEVGFAVHHTMQDFRNYRKKSLDLVICRPAGSPTGRTLLSFEHEWGLLLAENERARIEALPKLLEVPVGDVLVAMEAKACMTAHRKARPRLYDELNSSHLTVHGAFDSAIAVGFVLVNTAAEFVSTDLNKRDLSDSWEPVWSEHKPADAESVVSKMKQLPRRSNTGEVGFDAIGIVGVSCRNDGDTPVALTSDSLLTDASDPYQYDRMVQRVSTLLATRFPML